MPSSLHRSDVIMRSPQVKSEVMMRDRHVPCVIRASHIHTLRTCSTELCPYSNVSTLSLNSNVAGSKFMAFV